MDSTDDHGAHGRTLNHTDGVVRGGILLHQATTDGIIAAFYRVYRELGGGFVESVYAKALAIELAELGLRVDSEVAVSVFYRGTEVGRFRADQIVNGEVLVELKAAERLVTAHEQQLMNYLHATPIEVGMLLNFGPRPTFKRFLLTNNRKKL